MVYMHMLINKFTHIHTHHTADAAQGERAQDRGAAERGGGHEAAEGHAHQEDEGGARQGQGEGGRQERMNACIKLCTRVYVCACTFTQIYYIYITYIRMYINIYVYICNIDIYII